MLQPVEKFEIILGGTGKKRASPILLKESEMRKSYTIYKFGLQSLFAGFDTNSYSVILSG